MAFETRPLIVFITKAGNVAPELQKQMKKKLRDAAKFDPQPDYPQA